MNNGYTSIEINGEKIGLKFGMKAIGLIQENCKDMDLNDKIALATIGTAHILYAGYINNCMVKQMVPVHDFQFFYDALEDAFLEEDKIRQYQDAINCFNESKLLQMKTEPNKPNVKKKNGRGKMSKPSATGS